jgi:hypothetical protein
MLKTNKFKNPQEQKDMNNLLTTLKQQLANLVKKEQLKQ